MNYIALIRKEASFRAKNSISIVFILWYYQPTIKIANLKVAKSTFSIINWTKSCKEWQRMIRFYIASIINSFPH
jgi:hypothetical protein